MSRKTAVLELAPSYMYTVAVLVPEPRLLDQAVDHSKSMVPSPSQQVGVPSTAIRSQCIARYGNALWKPPKSLVSWRPAVAMAIDDCGGDPPELPSGLQQCDTLYSAPTS